MSQGNENSTTPFDKFMDSILEKESVAKQNQVKPVEDTPQRRYNKLYRENPHNRIKLGTKK